jgi:N-methylhydantoinase B
MRNTRLPQSAMGDLNGQLGALDLGVKRLDELLDEYGADTVSAALDRAAGPGRALMRAEVPRCPTGAGRPRISSTMTGSPTPRCRSAWRWRSRATGWCSTSPAPRRCAGPVNIALPTAVATACYVAIKHIFPTCRPMPA